MLLQDEMWRPFVVPGAAKQTRRRPVPSRPVPCRAVPLRAARFRLASSSVKAGLLKLVRELFVNCLWIACEQ